MECLHQAMPAFLAEAIATNCSCSFVYDDRIEGCCCLLLLVIPASLLILLAYQRHNKRSHLLITDLHIAYTFLFFRFACRVHKGHLATHFHLVLSRTS